ncbi:hypothetical protein F0562_000429 [Nyssa sinensis]|uniref:PGG domain-containing protein n=1 Tax=Nyssa sinensis TaxID=561372 RepID=A0A5J5C043_9ASTE|nr:hypothetical protein F0562_000429 [Nyssa sinensis]
MTNEDGDMALHEAVRHNHHEVVEVLTTEDPDFTHSNNNAEETPLYLAAERNYCRVVEQILTCSSPGYTGPDGRTALHAAVIRRCQECSKNLYDKKPAQIKEADINGWTPFHYAARFDLHSFVTYILEKGTHVAYLVAEKDDKKTALHISASFGSLSVMTKILERCPDSWEMVDGRGQNILHTAVGSKEEEIIQFISEQPWFISLINHKDADGNTPLHIYASSSDFKLPSCMKRQEVDINAFNKEKMTPLDVAIYNNISGTNESHPDEQLESVGATPGWRNIISRRKNEIMAITTASGEKSEVESDVRKTADTHLIVAALIATVTFAAGFTVPGGYDSNENDKILEGTPILLRKAAFKTFVISDNVAMICSTCAIFLHFIASAYASKERVLNHIAYASFLILISMGATVIAFITGLYTVLIPSMGLAALSCIIGCLSFPLYFFLLRNLYVSFMRGRTHRKKVQVSFLFLADHV